MNIISRHKVAERSRSANRLGDNEHSFSLGVFSRLSSLVSRLALAFLLFLVNACDFQGPWSYYPEEAEVYQGIYTFGYIVADESPYVCFSKVYGLTESSAENFAFYDSASVTVSGFFGPEIHDVGDTIAHLYSLESEGKPNCFRSEVSGEYPRYAGIAGESYTLNAVFKWDSAGHKVTTEFKAVAEIPTKIHAKGVIPPSVKGDAEFMSNEYDYLESEFLGFPFDVLTYKIPMEYDESVRGILMTMTYDHVEGGESMNNTLNNMMGAFLDPDSTGYGGISTKKPEESTANMGFTYRMMVGSQNSLDTMEYPGMTVPVGKSTVYFYATDQAYSDYENTVIAAISDSRVVAKSNVENGMGVFSGMLKDSLLLEVTTDTFVTYEHMREWDCFQEGGMANHKPFESKWCRLIEDTLCVEIQQVEMGINVLPKHSADYCMSVAERVRMDLSDEYDWNTAWFDYVDFVANLDGWFEQEKEIQKVLAHKDSINAKALRMFCAKNNFENNSEVDCDELREQCQVSLEKNDCKEFLWEWCSDRDWNIEEYPQCGTALTSRFYLEEMKSPILERVIKNWCEENPKDSQCSRVSF